MAYKAMNWLRKLLIREKAISTEGIRAKLIKDRIVFLGLPINDEAASSIIRDIGFLVEQNQTKPISLYVNSPGGAINSSMRIIRAMDRHRPLMTTINLKLSAGTAAIIVGHGARGSRFALSASVFRLEPASILFGLDIYNGAGGNPITVDHNDMAAILARDCRRELLEVAERMRQRLVLDAYDGQAYGLIDRVIDRAL